MGNDANHCWCHTIEANGTHENDEENDENQKLTVAERIEKIELPDKKASPTPDKNDPKRKSTPVCEIERKYINMIKAGAIITVLLLSLIVVVLAIKLATKVS